MKFFDTITKAARSLARPVVSRGHYSGRVHESFEGAWQRGVEHTTESVLNNPTLFRCINLIASDIAKCGLHLSEVEDGIWTETTNPAFSPVLRKPNHFQTRQLFIQSWVQSLLTNGNTYVLKSRDGRGVVTELFVLDPNRVSPLVSETGEVFYQLHHDDLARVGSEGTIVLASEIIHDRINCLFHPLIGLSPITAAGLAAGAANTIAANSAEFFANGSRPGGILTAPATLPEEAAESLKANMEATFSGKNSGRLLVLEDGLSYQPLAMSAVDSQLIDQMEWNARVVCSAFGVPSHLIGIGQAPTYNNIAALNQQYYSQVLQTYMTSIEEHLEEGLGLKGPLRIEFELDDLIRLDEASLVLTLKEAVNGSIITTNEARKRMNYKPTPGGDSVLSQEQYYSLAALAKRDEADPFAKPEPAPAPQPINTPEDEIETEAEKALAIIVKGFANV